VLKGGSRDIEPRACQNTKYGGNLGEVSHKKEDLLL